MRRARSLRLIAGVAAAALALAACGSDSNNNATSTTPPTSAPSSSPEVVTSATDTAAPTATDSTGSSETSGSESTGTSETSGGSSTLEPLDGSKTTIGFAYDIGGRGDFSFNDLAAKALDEAKSAYGIKAIELDSAPDEPDSAKDERLRTLVDQGATSIVAVGFAYSGVLATVAADNPKVHFAIIDDSSLCDPAREGGPIANVSCLVFAEEQGSFLVGVAAALKSESKHVGFIGGVQTGLIEKFQAGFQAGVAAVDKSIKVDVKYITIPPDFKGFNDPASAETIAKGMYDGGADIVYHAAGGSGSGLFTAAQQAGKKAIGVDSDQYNIPAYAAVKDVIMTSMLKRVDVATLDFITSAVKGAPLTGVATYDLKADGVGYSTSGGQIDDIVGDIDGYKAKIISGEIEVPAVPAGG
ncbi:BMP family ABC transporter substrate-binding protein [Nakamurella silvestris]|nr:BMP family ABC transporter substrate-binding protein [Nakamurella silvestris]